MTLSALSIISTALRAVVLIFGLVTSMLLKVADPKFARGGCWPFTNGSSSIHSAEVPGPLYERGPDTL